MARRIWPWQWMHFISSPGGLPTDLSSGRAAASAAVHEAGTTPSSVLPPEPDSGCPRVYPRLYPTGKPPEAQSCLNVELLCSWVHVRTQRLIACQRNTHVANWGHVHERREFSPLVLGWCRLATVWYADRHTTHLKRCHHGVSAGLQTRCPS